MNILLWILQIILCLACVYSGGSKTIFAEKKLIELGQTGVEGIPHLGIKLIGISEILLAAGFIFPWLFQTAPFLTSFSAACFCLVMVLACGVHYRRFQMLGIKKEKQNAVNNIILFCMSLLVCIGRA
jgi:hypothetical protein